MKKVILTYYDLCLWFVRNQDSTDYTTDQFEAVLKQIGQAEDKLRGLGTTEAGIQELIDQVAKAYSVKKTEWDPRI